MTPVEKVLADIRAIAKDESDKGIAPTPRHMLRPRQVKAVELPEPGSRTRTAGKLIMACGTGKTFTALRTAGGARRRRQVGLADTSFTAALTEAAGWHRHWSRPTLLSPQLSAPG